MVDHDAIKAADQLAVTSGLHLPRPQRLGVAGESGEPDCGGNLRHFAVDPPARGAARLPWQAEVYRRPQSGSPSAASLNGAPFACGKRLGGVQRIDLHRVAAQRPPLARPAAQPACIVDDGLGLGRFALGDMSGKILGDAERRDENSSACPGLLQPLLQGVRVTGPGYGVYIDQERLGPGHTHRRKGRRKGEGRHQHAPNNAGGPLMRSVASPATAATISACNGSRCNAK